MNTLIQPVQHDIGTNLYSQIQPGLFMGGTEDDDVCFGPAGANSPKDNLPFRAIVTMYAWAKPAYWEIQEMRYGIYDSNMEDLDLERLGEVVQFAHKHWKKGDRILIRCQAGLNRSGLVTALVLMLEGTTANEAILCIRQNRGSDALFNQNYVNWLRNDGAKFVANLETAQTIFSAHSEERNF